MNRAERFSIYRNLRTKTWSKRNSKGIVVEHPSQVFLSNVKFHVSLLVRARVVRRKMKEVHAWVKGNITDDILTIETSNKVEVTYNPYLYMSFVRVDNLQKVSSADFVYMDSEMKVWAINPK